MNCVLVCFFLSWITLMHGAYNPIPTGSVIISTTNKIFYMQPIEYGGTDELNIIFTATTGMTIVSSIYDSTAQNLYILYTNTTNSTVYLCQLAAVEQLASTVYQLQISFNTSDINQLYSFSSDAANRRGFLTDNTGVTTVFSMSGLMETVVTQPANIADPIRSVSYSNTLNALFVVTDSEVSHCTNFDSNNLQCCSGPAQAISLRSIAFDQVSGVTYVYVLDQSTGIYQAPLDTNGCPTALRPINTLGTYKNLQFVIDNGLYFASGSSQGENNNSLLVVANGTQTPRSIPVRLTIVALHLSLPSTKVVASIEQTCFHGITYRDYRIAVVLAAIFGTIMGIFMCFNALFCVDFIMTKRIIRGLKQQIPHNLLEDRWNKLVEEKYAKIALEKQRKKDDPPPKRQSVAAARKNSSVGATYVNVSGQPTEDSGNRTETLQVPNPIPKLSAYLRRKSESYLSRRRSDDYRSQRQQGREESPSGSYRQRNPATTVQVHIEPVQEDHHGEQRLRQNISQQKLIREDEDFL